MSATAESASRLNLQQQQQTRGSTAGPYQENRQYGVESNENRGAHNRHHLFQAYDVKASEHHQHRRSSCDGSAARGSEWGRQCQVTKHWEQQAHTGPGGLGHAGTPHTTALGEMGVGSSKHGYAKHFKDKKRHSKHSTQKIIVQSARLGGVEHDNENHHNAQTDSIKLPVAETFASKPGVDFSKFKVIKLKAAIDKKPTTLDEKSTAVLKYKTPHFRSLATVEVPCLEENQSVQVGWIQTCTQMKFVNTYGDEGLTSWEFPEIVSGKFQMIGDADGKQYPWYGSKNELASVSGPTKETTAVSVHMNDNFFPQVTWYIPDNEYDKTPRLTHIHRKQKFYTYLVAHDLSAQRYHILQVVEWSMELNIEVCPSQPLGKRAHLVGPMEQAQPRVLPTNYLPLQAYALKPPNANNAQTLIWRPRRGDPRMIVPPIETTMDMDKYIISTRNLDVSRTGTL